MALSDMQVFNTYVMPAIAELFPQEIAKFNEASAGAIVLTGEGFDGSFMEQSFYAAIHSSQRRVDRFAAIGAQATTDLTQLQHNTVKVAGGFGPIGYEPGQMTWLRKPTQEGLTIAAEQFVQALIADQLNTAIASLVAAISNVAGVTNNISATLGITQGALNNTHALFGDASQTLVADVMKGSTYHKLIGQALTNTEVLFDSGTVRVVDILGKRTIVTDSPALLDVTPVPDEEKILCLSRGAAVVSDSGDLITNVDTTNGQSRIETTIQMDYTFGLGLKGYSWDETNGGASPTDADLTTGTNWDQVATNIKHTAGAILIGDATK